MLKTKYPIQKLTSFFFNYVSNICFVLLQSGPNNCPLDVLWQFVRCVSVLQNNATEHVNVIFLFGTVNLKLHKHMETLRNDRACRVGRVSAQGSQCLWGALIKNKPWEKDDVQCRGRVLGLWIVSLNSVCSNPKPFNLPQGHVLITECPELAKLPGNPPFSVLPTGV